nr:MAG TPA: hypothetical protein [Caudoviricetes sp.]
MRGVPPTLTQQGNTLNPLFMGLYARLHPRKSCTKRVSFLHFTPYFGFFLPPHRVCSGKSFVTPVFRKCNPTL